MQKYGLMSFVIIILTSIILGLLYAKYKCLKDHINENIDTQSTEKIYEALAAVLEKLCGEKDYALVIRLGSAVSRVLWIAGQYKYRISIGDIIFSAACKYEDLYQMARVQIDDIGWTYFILKETEKAIENIKSGLLIAESINDNYLIAKAYRHLSGIFLSQGDSSKAAENITHAKIAAEKISDPVDKKEMLAGIDYSNVEILIKLSKLDEALTIAQKTFNEYSEILDMERKAKSLSQMGKIFLLKDDKQRAISSFSSGLGVAEKSCRRDETIKCLMGLAVTCYKRGDLSKARSHKNACEKLMQNGETFASWDYIINLYNNISNN